jgi:hypothetical protein
MPDSDYDIIGFREQDGPVARQTGWRDGALLDVFIYPAQRLEAPAASFLHVRGGAILCDRDDRGAQFLFGLEAIYAKGPNPLPPGECAALQAWAWKMLDRAMRGDVEGHYRRHWLLTALLENYFLIRGVWYPGSKEALKSLQTSNGKLYALFVAALEPGASLDAIKALVQAVSGDRVGQTP